MGSFDAQDWSIYYIQGVFGRRKKGSLVNLKVEDRLLMNETCSQQFPQNGRIGNDTFSSFLIPSKQIIICLYLQTHFLHTERALKVFIYNMTGLQLKLFKSFKLAHVVNVKNNSCKCVVFPSCSVGSLHSHKPERIMNWM